MSDVTCVLNRVQRVEAQAADERLALDEALTRLAQINAEAVEVVKLCFLVGLAQEQVAKELGVSVSTAERLWANA